MHNVKVRGSLRPPAPLRALVVTHFIFSLQAALPKPSVRLFASISQGRKRSLKKDFSFVASSPRRTSEDSSSLRCTLARLDDPEFVVDFSTYTSLLKYCRKAEALYDGERVHRHIVKNNLQHDLYLVSLLVLMYTDCGVMDEAHDVFVGLITRDEFVFTVILRTYARLESSYLAFQTFEQMLQEGLIPNKRVYISIFTACAKQLAVLQGKRMHASLLGTTFCADIATNTALVTMYNRCNNPDYAKWIFENMEELDAVTWNVMIASCLEQSQGRYALELFNAMQQQGVMLSKVTVIHVLDACGSELALSRGLQLHCSIMGSEIEPDIMVQTSLINMYGSCGKINYAERIFDKVESKDEVVWSAMIAVYSQCAQVSSAIHLFERMLQEGMVSNMYALSSILSGCAGQLVIAKGKQMHARMSYSGFTLDGALGNALINFYGKTSCLNDAWKAFHKMGEPNMVSWNAIIAACAEHRHVEGAYQVFCQLLQEAMLADRASFLSVLSACANQECLSEGKRLHACITASGFHADLNVDNALVNMYGKCGQLTFMQTIFEGMPAKNLITWNTLLGVYAQHGRDKEALELFEEMQEAGIAPDKLTFTSILSVCANQGALAEGKRLHEVFESRGFQLDQVVGSALVSLYGKCGSLREAKEVFDAIPECDVVIWNALITALSQNGQGEEVLEFFNCMQQRKIKPTGVTFISVLSACSHVGLIDEACHHFHAMQMVYNIDPVVDHYNCMIDLLGRAGRLEDAEQVLHTMSAEPTEASLMTLLGACRNELDDLRGQRLAEKVFKLDPESPCPYVMLSNIYALVGRRSDALTVMKSMRDKQLSFEPDEDMSVFFGLEENVVFHDQVYLEQGACVA
ncbi:hypothetical protein GOP47_0011977 [Adiantum capillus-veneris]|uniref:Pentatricopeptide repeat-containing protein n=1 Tax=Adiantum capillus-veneris TaxID=13818 RepID=A0A9D4UU62_ADICA|nr:hypothetical protein GOP47_0011977 [Adiantum capillus-veneris]